MTIEVTTGSRRLKPTDEELASYKTQVEALNNTELFQEFESWTSGDDYDGEFTWHGRLIMNLLRTELVKRLTKMDYFND